MPDVSPDLARLLDSLGLTYHPEPDDYAHDVAAIQAYADKAVVDALAEASRIIRESTAHDSTDYQIGYGAGMRTAADHLDTWVAWRMADLLSATPPLKTHCRHQWNEVGVCRLCWAEDFT